MRKSLFRLWQFFRFYRLAVTKYQLHSPFIFELATAILDDRRDYYAYRDVEAIRQKMLDSEIILQVRDYGTGHDRREPLKTIVRRAASSARQGRWLFRLSNWAKPATMLELGSSAGIGTMYLAAGARNAKFLTLEGCPETADVARTNLDILHFKSVEVLSGPFNQNLAPALARLQTVDLLYLDGDHRQEATLAYFEKCLEYANEKTVFAFDDVYWSEEMTVAWKQIQEHPRVTLSVDFFDLSLVFVNPDFRQKQHWKIVPSGWKIWKFF